MLALVIKASCVVNYPLTLLSKGIPIKLTKRFVILFEKTFAAIFLDRIGPVPVTFCVLNGKLFFFTIVNSHAPIKTKRIRSEKYLGSYQICERVCAIVTLLNGNLLSLTILKTGLCTKGQVIRLMEMLNLLRHPITVPMRFFSLMATHVKPGK